MMTWLFAEMSGLAEQVKACLADDLRQHGVFCRRIYGRFRKATSPYPGKCCGRLAAAQLRRTGAP